MKTTKNLFLLLIAMAVSATSCSSDEKVTTVIDEATTYHLDSLTLTIDGVRVAGKSVTVTPHGTQKDKAFFMLTGDVFNLDKVFPPETASEEEGDALTFKTPGILKRMNAPVGAVRISESADFDDFYDSMEGVTFHFAGNLKANHLDLSISNISLSASRLAGKYALKKFNQVSVDDSPIIFKWETREVSDGMNLGEFICSLLQEKDKTGKSVYDKLCSKFSEIIIPQSGLVSFGPNVANLNNTLQIRTSGDAQAVMFVNPYEFLKNNKVDSRMARDFLMLIPDIEKISYSGLVLNIPAEEKPEQPEETKSLEGISEITLNPKFSGRLLYNLILKASEDADFADWLLSSLSQTAAGRAKAAFPMMLEAAADSQPTIGVRLIEK